MIFIVIFVSPSHNPAPRRHLLNEIERYKQAAEEAKNALKEGQAAAGAPPPSDSALQQKIAKLTQELQTKKMDEEALLAEMEVTGQAFENLQEQNGEIGYLVELRQMLILCWEFCSPTTGPAEGQGDG